MLDVLTTITSQGEKITLFGKIDEATHTIELNFHMTSKVADFGREIIYQPKMDFQVVDMGARSYSVYGCKFTKNQLSFSSTAVSVIKGTFERLIEESTLSKKYNTVWFSFDGIEKLFSLESFITQYEENGEITFTKGKKNISEYVLSQELVCTVESVFNGIYQSDKLYNLNITQDKAINLTFQNVLSAEALLQTVEKVKLYFEFILKQELQIRNIRFSNSTDVDRQSKIIYDPILQPHTFIRSVKDDSFRDGEEKLFSGLKKWLELFDKYSEVIRIWQKTIYNTNVSGEDLFIWRCQAYELLCSITKPILDKAITLKERRQANPNLKNFLSATNSIYKFSANLDPQYYKDLKEVRDKLTHNNPLKVVTDLQKTNSFALIEYFLIKTIGKIMNIEGVPQSLYLGASSNRVKSQN